MCLRSLVKGMRCFLWVYHISFGKNLLECLEKDTGKVLNVFLIGGPQRNSLVNGIANRNI